MKQITITTLKGNTYTGDWNLKFYPHENNTFRVYLHNVPGKSDNGYYVISNDEKERILSQLTNNKIEEDNIRINLIKREFEKLDDEAKLAFYNFIYPHMRILERKQKNNNK